MKTYLDFAFKISFITTVILGIIEWRIPGFVSYVFPFPILIAFTAILALLSSSKKTSS